MTNKSRIKHDKERELKRKEGMCQVLSNVLFMFILVSYGFEKHLVMRV